MSTVSLPWSINFGIRLRLLGNRTGAGGERLNFESECTVSRPQGKQLQTLEINEVARVCAERFAIRVFMVAS